LGGQLPALRNYNYDAGTLKAARHAELVSASVDFEITTLSKNSKIHHYTDAETSLA